MALTDAKKASDARHNAKLDQIMIKPYKDEGVAIRDAAKTAGQSLQGYILQAVRQKMRADAAGEYLIRISKAGAEANATRKGQNLEDWLNEHQ